MPPQNTSRIYEFGSFKVAPSYEYFIVLGGAGEERLICIPLQKRRLVINAIMNSHPFRPLSLRVWISLKRTAFTLVELLSHSPNPFHYKELFPDSRFNSHRPLANGSNGSQCARFINSSKLFYLSISGLESAKKCSRILEGFIRWDYNLIG